MRVGDNVEFVLSASWTKERYAQLVHVLSSIGRLQVCDEVVLEWEGGQPSLWQLAWIAECVRQLKKSEVRWRWRGSGEQLAPAWLDAGGLQGVGGIPRHN